MSAYLLLLIAWAIVGIALSFVCLFEKGDGDKLAYFLLGVFVFLTVLVLLGGE